MEPNSVIAATKFTSPNPDTAPRTGNANKYGSSTGYISTNIFLSQYTVHGATSSTRPTSTKYSVNTYRVTIARVIALAS